MGKKIGYKTKNAKFVLRIVFIDLWNIKIED